jgi:adenosylcobinamide-phosphate synthase
MDAATQAVLALLAAVAVDILLGEYPRLLHPVVWIGQTITLCLRFAPSSGWWRQLVFGAFLALFVPAAAAGLTLLALRAATSVPILHFLLAVFFLKASFALCELWRAAKRVLRPLEQSDLPRARETLRALCSRDPSNLSEQELLAATTESLAENASDSFVAPLFYYLLLGVPGAIAYRAINTLDAMIGYRGRFEALGKAAARLDDLVNWIPARLTAFLFLLVGGLTGGDVAGGLRILRRDGARTPSPNGGRPMAVMAGLLGVELAKKGVYILGDSLRPLTAATVRRAWLVVLLAGLVMTGLCVSGLLLLVRA